VIGRQIVAARHFGFATIWPSFGYMTARMAKYMQPKAGSILRRIGAAALAVGVVVGAGLAVAPVAEARIFVGIGVGPWWGDPYYYAPYYAPPPVYVAPPPYMPPAYVPPTSYVAPAAMWYYCDDPAGYYPYVKNCYGPWHPVPARP
jgi:hypothetical protein